MIPRPRLHLIHFHGVLAPRSRLRPLIVPCQESEGYRGLEDRANSSLPDDKLGQIHEYEDFPARQISKRTWSQLLSRVFGIDGLKCPGCFEGRHRLVAFITEEVTIEKILTAMHIPTHVPRAAPARPPPLGELIFDETV